MSTSQCNTLSRSAQIKIESGIKEKLNPWLMKWIANCTPRYEFAWNNRIFGDARPKELTPELQHQDWQTLVSYIFGEALSSDNIAPNKIEQLIEKCRNDLFSALGWRESKDVHTQISCCINVVLTPSVALTILLPEPTVSSMRKGASQPTLSGNMKHISQDVINAQKVKLDVTAQTQPMSLDKLGQLKVGERIPLNHKYDEPFTLVCNGETYAQGYLAKRNEQKVIVVKGSSHV
ncbi:FliM/FliN family flagellar motor C-terminal domain-containing protein [Aestuariibacter sp. AA17]|uniref:FliM/FliN family flagellar motor C-terminal domain-containing protein n=1 Tax=Fluctibacter corallii TaxID=2984329 RepID=A0ABT3AAI5_9ALTE|nr:FliM/FliN family flagellar motor C-terminal domain-containing protein [Aestuariibacter sp. AA17]MCV2885307.1 FliM/FliN family flagellar motor C-terminal domain-containing protein [Aestuariibacter sp. AA17]